VTRKLKILTWHQHGSYLAYLTHVPHGFYLPVKPGRPHPYGGKVGPFGWGDNVHEVPVDEVPGLDLDCIVFQSVAQYAEEQHRVLSAAQRRLPRIYIEHDPPRANPTDTKHPVDDPDVLLVHVTPFNELMWDSGRTPTRVIDHGVPEPVGVSYVGDLARGIVVVNNLYERGRRLGADVYERALRDVPLDLVGMGATGRPGGIGEVPHDELPAFAARYRFFFNPIRYTSMGLAVCEAMMIGMPIVGLATTEMATAIENGTSGFVDTDIRRVVAVMQDLLGDPSEAARLGAGARRRARERFSIERFVRDWEDAFALVTGTRETTAMHIGQASAA
jgi:hypothetical protein